MRKNLVISIVFCASLSFSAIGFHSDNGGHVLNSPDSASEESNSLNIEFEAHRNGSNVELKWAVTGFVQYFYIERSLDRENWEPIMRMSGSNQTHHRTEYFDVDYKVPSTKLFYRIKQVFYSGETSSSFVAFVPPFDDIMKFEERTIKTITDPIKVGSRIDLVFINFSEQDLLLVLRDQCGDEFYTKVRYVKNGKYYEVTETSEDIPSGQYLITASSKKDIYSSSLRIEFQD
ncbi:MAG: hypothetical protein WEC59_01595 [Salibacteraceae bacterium]